MKRRTLLFFFTLFTAALAVNQAQAEKSAADLEREKAMKEPYANDYGPETVPADILKTYPKAAQEGYKALQNKCTACHSAARPLNSQFIETAGKKVSERTAALNKLKKDQPGLFKKGQKAVWQIEAKIWQRYVKRMMNKPGCEVTKKEGKAIWTFLSHDSRARKLAKKADWEKKRGKMLSEFKKEHPKRYKELYEH